MNRYSEKSSSRERERERKDLKESHWEVISDFEDSEDFKLDGSSSFIIRGGSMKADDIWRERKRERERERERESVGGSPTKKTKGFGLRRVEE